MLEIQPNKDPFLFVNSSLKVEYLKSASCTLLLSPTDWFFKCHWPDNPNMPAALQLESMTQVGGMILFVSLEKKPKYLYVRKISNATFYRKVIPGTEIRITSNVIKYQNGVMSVVSNIKCEKTEILFSKSEFTLINPDVIPKVS